MTTSPSKRREISPDALYEKAVVYLLKMPKTEQQVRRWYAQKTFDQALIEEQIARLKDHNLLDDVAYANTYVQCKKDKMGLGLIKNKLRVNGVAPAIIEQAVTAVADQRELLVQNVEKYLRNKERTPVVKAKLLRWLLAKGFAYDQCGEVIDECWH